MFIEKGTCRWTEQMEMERKTKWKLKISYVRSKRRFYTVKLLILMILEKATLRIQGFGR